jgi:hypothetical protein
MFKQVLEMTSCKSQTCLTPVKHGIANCSKCLSRKNCWYCAPDNLFKAVSSVYAFVCRFYKGYVPNIRSGKSPGVVSVNKQATNDA